MTGIDNGLGLGIGLNAGVNNYDKIVMRFRNSKIYGESPAPDCPQNGQGGYCFKFEKCGLMSAISITKTKPIHPDKPSPKPYHKPKSYGVWGATALYENMEFINWYPNTQTGARQTVLCLNPKASDYIPPHQFNNTKFNKVQPSAMAYIKSPDPAWANLKDCIEFPCTAPLNILFDFQNTKYSGSSLNHGAKF